MFPSPTLYFHSAEGYHWENGTDLALQKLHTLNDAPIDLLPSLTIKVSQPDTLMTWLETNNAALITDLIIWSLLSSAPSPQQWCRLFDRLQREANNIQHLNMYWEAEGPWGEIPPCDINNPGPFEGLGKSVVFLRGLAQLKVKKSVKIGGFYAKHWPRYLEAKMGLKPINMNDFLGSFGESMLRDYQEGTEGLNPFTDEGSPNFGRE
ncbi:MAG: hypothetical protein M1813_006483 [Trichoglossum hirsutum]|nr:MAG: hypothetical protein M1813_006483 [Trichoglossum hirsutum]